MVIRNFTPFVPFLFESEDRDRETFVTFLLKGTFDIIPGGRLRPSPRQDPLTMGDEYYDEPLTSSIRFESDLAPTKVNADVIIVADAIAPRGEVATRWEIGVTVRRGEKQLVDKRLAVTGERSWKYSLLKGWHVTDPDPCSHVPLIYENAFGGSYLDEHSERCEYPANPIGRGYVGGRRRKSDDLIPAPRIESIVCPIREIDDRYDPEGVGAIGKVWKSRLEYAGTYDDRWLAEAWPHLPEDFDFQFYNAAPADMQVEGFLRGDEDVELKGMQRDGTMRFRLPEYRVGVFFKDRSDQLSGNDLDLDTLTIDVRRMKAYLVWRIATPKLGEILEIEPRMELRTEAFHGG